MCSVFYRGFQASGLCIISEHATEKTRKLSHISQFYKRNRKKWMHVRNLRGKAEIKKPAVGFKLIKRSWILSPWQFVLYKYWQGVAIFQLVKANPLQDFEYQNRLWPVLQLEAGTDPVPVLP